MKDEALEKFIKQKARGEYYQAREEAIKELITDIHEMNPPDGITTTLLKSYAHYDPLNCRYKCVTIFKINDNEFEIEFEISEFDFIEKKLPADRMNLIIDTLSKEISKPLAASCFFKLKEISHR